MLGRNDHAGIGEDQPKRLQARHIEELLQGEFAGSRHGERGGGRQQDRQSEQQTESRRSRDQRHGMMKCTIARDKAHTRIPLVVEYTSMANDLTTSIHTN